MKRNFKLLLCLCMLVVLLTGCGCTKKKADEKRVYNTNSGVVKKQVIEGLEFDNTSLSFSDNRSIFTTTVTNQALDDIKIKVFYVVVKDKKGNTLTTLEGYIGESLPKGQSRTVQSNVDINLKNAFEVEYRLTK